MVKGRLCLARQLLRSNFILSSTCILCCFVRSTVLYVSLWCSTEVQKITMQCSLSYCGFTRLQDFICDHNFMCCASTTLWIFLLFVFPLRWTGQKFFILQTPRSWKLELARHTQNHHSLFVDALKKMLQLHCFTQIFVQICLSVSHGAPENRAQFSQECTVQEV